MAAHTQIRFTRLEIRLRDAAEQTLADPAATVADKRQARRDMHDTLRAAQKRHLVKRAKDALGSQPRREDFATEAEYVQARETYRTGLDKIACDEILDNPNPLPKRNMARRTLAEIERKERLSGIAPRSAQPDSLNAKTVPRAVTHRSAPVPTPDETPLDPAAARFFEMEEAKQASEGEPPTVLNGPLRSEVQAPQLFCERHQTPLSICGCANNEICPLCLIPRSNCGHR